MLKNGVPVLDATTLRTITVLGRAGESLWSIQRATGIRRERISKILKGQGIRVRPPRFRRLPQLATIATAPVTSREVQLQLPFPGRGGPEGDTPTRFTWDFPDPPSRETAEHALPATALRWALPLRLQAREVRLLRDHVAARHDLEDAAKRMGIDRWVSRAVGTADELAIVADEIRDRLYYYESRRRP